MIEALSVLAMLIRAVLAWLWSLIWWWGPLLAALLGVAGARLAKPGTGRRRAGGQAEAAPGPPGPPAGESDP